MRKPAREDSNCGQAPRATRAAASTIIRLAAVLITGASVLACTGGPVQPTQEWTAYSPADHYRISVPSNWSDTSDPNLPIASFDSPDRKAFVSVSDQPAGPRQMTVEIHSMMVSSQPSLNRVKSFTPGPGLERKVVLFDEYSGNCATSADTLHVVRPERTIHITVEVCRQSARKYDQAFVHNVFTSFELEGQKVVSRGQLEESPLWNREP